MAFDSADALAKTYARKKTYARNKKLLSLRSITNGLQQTGLLVAYTYRASVHLDPPLSAQRSAWPRRWYLDQAGGRADRRDDQKPGNVIANDQFASPTDLEMTSTFGPWRTRAVRCTCLLLADCVAEVC
jgi:hypothetical protein